MIGWFGVAQAADGHLDAIVGVRTQPDAALEQPTLWDPEEVEPAGVGAVIGSASTTHGGLWAGIDASAWGMFPEPDPSLLALGPKAGIGGDVGPTRIELAARYDAQWYPLTHDATNGRAEGLGTLRLETGPVSPEVSVEGIDRRYPFEPRWSFSTEEVDLGLRAAPESGGWWARGSVGAQGNQSGDAEGSQLRGTLRLGWSARRWDLWAEYQLIDAFHGEEDDVERSQFTPLGDYVEDADALSGGGFVQHRGELGGSVQAGPWTARASALGRLRHDAGPATYDHTFHAQVDLERATGAHFAGLLTAGVSAVHLTGGPQYLDLYLWTGVSWRPH